MGWSSLRKGPFLPREKRKAPNYSHPTGTTSRSSSSREDWSCTRYDEYEDVEMEDQDPQTGISSGSQGAETDRNQQTANPRTSGQVKLDFHQNEVTPQYKVALMTATAGHLGVPQGIGHGLRPAEPEERNYADNIGFQLLVKGMTCRMQQVAGDYQPEESPEDYMRRLARVNTPVIDAAAGWKSNAEKRFRKFNRVRFERDSDAGNAPLEWTFTRGGTEGRDYTPSRPAEVYVADGRRLELDEDEEIDAREEPCLVTAFDASVWDLLNEAKEATTEELRRTMEQAAANVPGPASAADVPVPAGDTDAEL